MDKTADLSCAQDEPSIDPTFTGRIVKLDRGLPLIECADGMRLRAEYDVLFSKESGRDQTMRGVVVGDCVRVSEPSGHERPIIIAIEPRKTVLVRRDPAPGAQAQVLAANFDWVLVTEPADGFNRHRLERALVIAHLTGASIAVLITKCDLVNDRRLEAIRSTVAELAGSECDLILLGEGERNADDEDRLRDERALESLRQRLAYDGCAVLIGQSGVGKSSLVNRLVGREVQKIGTVRARDGKGRHTTTSREMVALPSGGWIIDMPGVRGLGLWDAHEGIDSAFSDVTALASQCRFRDCRHDKEPDCAVRAAVEAGELSPLRLRSYRLLKEETERNARQALEQTWHR